MTTCRYHPDQAGVGLCMRCRSVICAACCTQLDGINHCHACLRALATRPARRPQRVPPLVSVGLLLAGVWVLLFGLLLLAQGGAAP